MFAHHAAFSLAIVSKRKEIEEISFETLSVVS